LKPKKV